jgi:hypothetical protein
MTTLRTLTAAAALLLTTTACSTTAARPNAGPLPPAQATSVEVTNNNWSDMVVYAVRSGVRQRLGTVTSMTTERLEISRALALPGADLYLVADPIGGSEGFNTGRIMVSPGQRIELTIQNHLAISNYSVWE